MKLGIELNIDVTKVDKSRLYTAESGAKYLTMTTFIDTENPNEYGKHGFISEKQTKEERESNTYTTILGNATVFWEGESQNSSQTQPEPKNNEPDSDSIPF